MITGETDSLTRDQSALGAFVERASGRLAAVRNGILIFDQDRNSEGDIEVALRSLQLLSRDAAENDRHEIVELAKDCETHLSSMISSDPSATDIGRTLDLVARVEEQLLKIPLDSDDFLNDVSGFVDRSFEIFQADEKPAPAPVPTFDEIPIIEETIDFEVDEETLEIFRSEATELLTNISDNIELLQSNSGDREALWEVRRNAHTFKGAAGIIGLKAASTLAHRVEDLLDKMVEVNAAVDADIVNLLARASKRLEVFTLGTAFDEEVGPIDALYAEFETVIASIPDRQPIGLATDRAAAVESPTKGPNAAKPANTPIVRVALDRLDDLIQLSNSLTLNRSSIVDRLGEFLNGSVQTGSGDKLIRLQELLEAHKNLTEEMREKLFRIRMVRFGTLETRLSRAVHVTCEEEGKRASVTVENGDCEVDTQVIDALIEPLLHLLKNAVVHGIEPEDTRRLIGKPEKGHIKISVSSDEYGVTLTVSDDGRGIATSRIRQKAINDGIITPAEAGSMSDAEAFMLIFHRGLTTADKLNLNAGRGVGMSIVKEGLESHGGSIRVESEPQVGTTFTLRMPLSIKKEFAADRTEKPADDGVRSPNARCATILVVDDSASVRRQTTRLVESAGHRVLTAVNGAEAMELLLSNVWRPDVILSDVEMPTMDGWEFLECVKNTDGLCEIPVIMVTSLDADEHVMRAYELGAADYKIKPLNKPELVHAIDRILDGGFNAQADGSA